MTFKKSIRSALVALAIVASCGNLHADLIGVTWDFEDGLVYRISETTGEAVLIGHSGLSRMNSLAQDSLGRLYTVGSRETGPGPSNVLAKIDPLTGAARVIGPLTGLENVNILSMAFSPDGILFAYHEETNGTGDRIITIDPATAEVTVIAEVTSIGPGVGALMGLDFAPDGLLYGWGTNDDLLGLVLIDPATGIVVDVDSTVGAVYRQGLQTLVFSEDGTLFGQYDSSYCSILSCVAQGTLVKIDPASGAQTFIGTNIAKDIRGLAIYKIPEITELTVDIDIKPDDELNTINPDSYGVVPVAILSSDEFDATTVDPSTVRLEGAQVAVHGKGKLLAHEDDIDGDGLIDLVCQIETDCLTLDWDVGEVYLTGETLDGETITGSDFVLIAPVAD